MCPPLLDRQDRSFLPWLVKVPDAKAGSRNDNVSLKKIHMKPDGMELWKTRFLHKTSGSHVRSCFQGVYGEPHVGHGRTYVIYILYQILTRGLRYGYGSG